MNRENQPNQQPEFAERRWNVNEVLASIRTFLAGDLSPQEFREHLYTDPRFEEFLGNDPDCPRHHYYARYGVYVYLLELDFDDFADVLDAQSTLADFLDRHHIEYQRSQDYEKLLSVLWEARPAWLSVEPKYLRDHILPVAGTRKGQGLVAWLREEYLRRFRCIGEPPQWIQAPVWPIGENGPLIFFGQLAVDGFFHDEAAVYVFYDSSKDSCVTVVQVA